MSQTDGDKRPREMSKALPFAPRPKLLDGTLPGDAGFEYVSLVQQYMRSDHHIACFFF